MKRCIETTYSSRKQSKHNPSIIEIEALFDFGHVLQKKLDSGKGKRMEMFINTQLIFQTNLSAQEA